MLQTLQDVNVNVHQQANDSFQSSNVIKTLFFEIYLSIYLLLALLTICCYHFRFLTLLQLHMEQVSEQNSFLDKKLYTLHIASQLDPCDFLYDFASMSDVKFKQLLHALALNVQQRDFLNEHLHTKENIIFIRQLFHLINRLKIVNSYMQKILHEKEILLSRREHLTNPSYIDNMFEVIGDRQLNIIHRAQYNLELRLKALSSDQS